MSVTGGVAGLTGDGSEYWKPGFTAGGNGFVRVTTHILMGVRISYSRWTPAEKTIFKDFGYPDIKRDISGSRSTVEIAPSVRFLAPMKDAFPFEVFAHIAAGLYIIDEETTITVSFANQVDTYTDGESDKRIGVSLGVGVDIGYIEILPMITVLPGEGKPNGYYSISAGAEFSF